MQNLPVPFDRRVWLECQALTSAGYHVTVVCPNEAVRLAEDVIDGVTLYRYPPPRTGSTMLAFVLEYLYSFTMTVRLVFRAWRTGRFAILQACNPPDIFWPIALLMRPFGVRFVFDHHDLCPELYRSKFGATHPLVLSALRLLEWSTFRSAHHVVSTNESYRAIAIGRGRKRPSDVTVVRTGPDPVRMRRVAPRPDLRRGRPHLVVYLGVMGPQDGVDLAVRAVHAIVVSRARDDISFTFIGAGESLPDLQALRTQLGVDDQLALPGRLPDDEVALLLSTADVGLCPDPKNPLNDLSTMNKTMEYMAFGLPVVAFDLKETRVSAGDAAVYARPNDVCSFADLVVGLIDDAPRRKAMGAEGRRRVEEALAWSHQQERYVGIFNALTARRPADCSDESPTTSRA